MNKDTEKAVERLQDLNEKYERYVMTRIFMFVATALVAFSVGGLTFGAYMYTEADKQAIASMLADDTIDMLEDSVERYYEVEVRETRVDADVKKLFFVAVKNVDASVITIEMHLKKVDNFVYRWVEE